MTYKRVVLTGKELTLTELVDIANDKNGEVQIVLGELAQWRIEKAREAVENEVAKGAAIYGTTTRTGPEKARSAPDSQEFQREVAAGYAGRWGKGVNYFPPGTCRLGWVIILNQFAQGSTIISSELATELCTWINTAFKMTSPYYRFLPYIEKNASISYADLTAPMQLMLGTLAKQCITMEGRSEQHTGYKFKPGEVLALGSSNSFTMAEMVLSMTQLEDILFSCEESAAMDIEAERSTPFIVSKAAEEVAQWQEKKEVINRMRQHLERSKVWVDKPSSIHPFCTLRASPDIIANTWEVLNNAKKVLYDMINGHQGNPVVMGFWNSDEVSDIQIGPVCSFDSTRLFCSLSSLKQAVGCLAVSIGQRTEHLINENGKSIPQLFSRRFEVFTESALRDCLLQAQVIPAVMGRMNCSGGYDWAAPAAQAVDSLGTCFSALVRLMSVNLLVSCAVIRNKLGEEAASHIGAGLQNLFRKIQERSFETLDPSEPFNFEAIIEYLEEKISKKNTNMMDLKLKVLGVNDGIVGNFSRLVTRGASPGHRKW